MKKILIVDDSETQRIQLRNDLRKAGYEVVEAINGLEGLALARSHGDVVLTICDFNMPVMDGITMCATMRAENLLPSSVTFMMTTEASAELKSAAHGAGVRAWFTKPYVPERLLEAIKTVLAK